LAAFDGVAGALDDVSFPPSFPESFDASLDESLEDPSLDEEPSLDEDAPSPPEDLRA
jgi:hypothetical protein